MIGCMLMLPLKGIHLMIGYKNNLCQYVETVLNTTLSSDADSIQSSFAVLESADKNNQGLMVLFPQPSTLVYNKETYFRIYDIISTTCWPQYTLPRPTNMILVSIDDQSFGMSRAFFFPLSIGRPKRIIGTVDEIFSDINVNRGIQLMKGLVVGPKCRTFALSGNTGSGKTDGAVYLNENFIRTTSTSGKPSTVIFIDAKKSSGARWARKHPNVELLTPNLGERHDDFLVRVTDKLSNVVDHMYHVQDQLFNSTNKVSVDANVIDIAPTWVTISEFEALTINSNSKLTKILMRELELIALLGRESLTGFCLDLQVARNDILPIPIRSQINCRILLGRIDSSTTTYFFPDLDNIVTPFTGPGTGIVDINDGLHSGIVPLALPTIKEEN